MDHSRTTCIACGSGHVDRRMWIDQEGNAPGEEGHNFTYAHTLFYVCRECGAGYIEKLDHDCFDYEEVWDQYEWYALGRADVSLLMALLAPCLLPLLPSCACPIHQVMRAATADLPRQAWRFGMEAEEHIHKIRLDSAGEALRFELA